MAKKKLYIYESGSCRGDEFTNKSIMDMDKAMALVDEGTKERKKGEDELDEFIEDRIYDNDDLDYDKARALIALINGSDCDNDSTRKVNARIKKVREGGSCFVFMEESTIGFASSKKEARNICLTADGEEW